MRVKETSWEQTPVVPRGPYVRETSVNPWSQGMAWDGKAWGRKGCCENGTLKSAMEKLTAFLLPSGKPLEMCPNRAI